MPMSMENGAGSSAVEADSRAVGGGGERLGPVAAIHFDGVDAGAAFVQVGVVARIPDHPVVAAFAEDLIVGIAAGERVVLGAAKEEIESSFAQERVVAAPGRRVDRFRSRR